MKKLLILLLALMPFIANAQNNRVTEICGVKFGSSYMSAKYILEARYGKCDIEDDDDIIFLSKEYNGLNFDMIGFRFNSSLLNHVVFSIMCETKEEARSARDIIAEMLKKQYTLTQKVDNDGEIALWGGSSPFNPDEYGFFVAVDKVEGFENYPYAAFLCFGPYGYGK